MPGYNPCCKGPPCGWLCSDRNISFACCWPMRGEFPSNSVDPPNRVIVDFGNDQWLFKNADAEFVSNNMKVEDFVGEVILNRSGDGNCTYYTSLSASVGGTVEYYDPLTMFCTSSTTMYPELFFGPTFTSYRLPHNMIATSEKWCYELVIRLYGVWDPWFCFNDNLRHVGGVIARYRTKEFDLAETSEDAKSCISVLKGGLTLFSIGDDAVDEQYWDSQQGFNRATSVHKATSGVPDWEDNKIFVDLEWD